MYKKTTYSITKLLRKESANKIKQPLKRLTSWNEREKEDFIKHLVSEDFINPIILNKSGDNLECIDGFSRIQAIKEFIDGDLEVDILGKGEKITFQEFSNDFKSQFREIRLEIVVYEDLSVKDKLELFKKYNCSCLNKFQKFILNCHWCDVSLTDDILNISLFVDTLRNLKYDIEQVIINYYMVLNDNIDNINDEMRETYLTYDNLNLNNKFQVGLFQRASSSLTSILKKVSGMKSNISDEEKSYLLKLENKELFIAMFFNEIYNCTKDDKVNKNHYQIAENLDDDYIKENLKIIFNDSNINIPLAKIFIKESLLIENKVEKEEEIEEDI